MQTRNFILCRQENQAVQDAYSMLTTNVHLSSEYKEIKTLAITGYRPGEGKTSLAINLAMTMAEWGRNVLLVDTDMRKLAKVKGQSRQNENFGISEVIKGEKELNEVLCNTLIDNLKYLPAGRTSSKPMSLLCSTNFDKFLSRARNEYDLVIFDTPSLSSVGDATLIAAKADATLLVAKMGKTNFVTLKRAKEKLEEVNANILGVVLNRIKKRDYKRYFETYNYFEEESKTAKNKSEKNTNIAVNAKVNV